MGGRSAGAPPRTLRRLAAAAGIETAYVDVFGRRCAATTETLVGVLQAMGLPLRAPEDSGRELSRLESKRADRPCDPVIVAWRGAGQVRLRQGLGKTRLTLLLEGGGEMNWVHRGGTARLPPRVPIGIHTLRVEARSVESTATVLAAPAHCHQPEGRSLGVFVPLYALRSGRSWGTADVTDLRRLMDWADQVGAGLVGTLPLLACFLEDPFDPSPYAPASRLFWNPLYADVLAAPEAAASPEIRRLLSSEEFRRDVLAARGGGHVDYRRAWALKRRVLERLAEVAYGTEAGRRRIRATLRANPELERFAEFMAGDGREPGGTGPARIYEREKRFHVYAQVLIGAQMRTLAARNGAGLYLDLPIGVHARGFDVRRYPDQFATSATVGAPPDAFFVRGQNWGFPPMHPEGSRHAGHGYFIASVRHHMQHARALRIDHVMGLHRLYWIPQGMDGQMGAYVRYPAEELYAILCIESQRARCRVIGENLGTVPPAVGQALRMRRILGMWIGVFEEPPKRGRWGAKGTLAAMGTHDTPTFGGFWTERDIPLRCALGHLTEAAVSRERQSRGNWRRNFWNALVRQGEVSGRSDPRAAHEGILEALARGPSEVVLASLEDLWLEPDPQNVPGTFDEHVNWRRRCARTLEEITAADDWKELLRRVSSRLCSAGGR